MIICREEVKVLSRFSEDTYIEINIGDDVKVSTLDIICKKWEDIPKITQYIICKCFILEFELFCSNFFEEHQDSYRYTGKRIVFHENMEAVNVDNIMEFMEEGRIIEVTGLLKYI